MDTGIIPSGVDNIELKDIANYAGCTIKKPTSIPTIKKIISRIDCNCDAIQKDQSLYIYQVCKNHLEEAKRQTEDKLLYCEKKEQDDRKGYVAFVLSRSGKVRFWAIQQISVSTWPRVGFAKYYEIRG